MRQRADKGGGRVSAAISGNCRIWNININWSIVYPNPRFDLMLKLWKYEPGNLASIISCHLCAQRATKEVCLQETRLLFKLLHRCFAHKMQITGFRCMSREVRGLGTRAMAFGGLARAKPPVTTTVPGGEMGWSNWLGNQLDACLSGPPQAGWMKVLGC